MKLLVAIDGIPDAESEMPELIKRLAKATGRPSNEWQRALLAPALARIVLSASSKADAEQIGERLESAGLTSHVVDAAEGEMAIEQAFEATWAEPSRDSLLCIAADGRNLEVQTGNIRLVVVGRAVKGGQPELFVVLGLRADPGAVILRFPGADVSKLVRGRAPETPQECVDGMLNALGRMAPHAIVDRGLEKGGKLSGLDELGTKDLAHAGVVASWLHHKFPPKPKVKTAHADAMAAQFGIQSGGGGNAPVESPFPDLDLAGSPKINSARDLPVPGAPGALDEPPPPSQQPPKPRSWDPPPKSPAELQAASRKRMIAAGIAVVVLGLVAFEVLHTPAKAERIVHQHESWKTPYGVTFTYDSSFNAGIEDVADVGFAVIAQKGSESQTFKIPHRDEATWRSAYGVEFHIPSADDAAASWVDIEAKRP